MAPSTAVTLCLLAFAAVGSAQYTSPANAAASTPSLSTLLAGVEAAGLATTLSSPTANLTVLAPTNTAFTAALAALMLTPAEGLASPLLAPLLEYHVIAGAAKAADLKDGETLTTLEGQTLKVSKSGSTVTFVAAADSANVITPDITAGSSVVHIIDAVLIPDLTALPPSPAASGPALAEGLATYEAGLAPAPAPESSSS